MLFGNFFIFSSTPAECRLYIRSPHQGQKAWTPSRLQSSWWRTGRICLSRAPAETARVVWVRCLNRDTTPPLNTVPQQISIPHTWITFQSSMLLDFSLLDFLLYSPNWVSHAISFMSVCMKAGMAETQWSIDWLLLRLHVLLELWTLYVNSKALTSFRFCPKAKYLADKCVWSRCICLHVARVSLKACMCAMSTCVWTAVWVWESKALGGHLQTERLFSQAPTSHSPLTVPGSTLKTLAFPHTDIFNIANVHVNAFDCEKRFKD